MEEEGRRGFVFRPLLPLSYRPAAGDRGLALSPPSLVRPLSRSVLTGLFVGASIVLAGPRHLIGRRRLGSAHGCGRKGPANTAEHDKVYGPTAPKVSDPLRVEG